MSVRHVAPINVDLLLQLLPLLLLLSRFTRENLDLSPFSNTSYNLKELARIPSRGEWALVLGFSLASDRSPGHPEGLVWLPASFFSHLGTRQMRNADLSDGTRRLKTRHLALPSDPGEINPTLGFGYKQERYLLTLRRSLIQTGKSIHCQAGQPLAQPAY